MKGKFYCRRIYYHRSFLLGLSVLLLTGCQANPWANNLVSSKPIRYTAGSEQTLDLTYRLDAGRMSVPLALTKVENQTISYQQAASNPVPKKSIGTLIAKYPHPAGREGYALLGVVIESDVYKFQPAARDSWWWNFNAGKEQTKKLDLLQIEKGAHEAWVLDIPKQQLDEILLQMNSELSSYQQSTTGEAELDLRWGKNKQHLQGQALQQLDRLMVRIRGEGQLVSYHRPAKTTNSKQKNTPYGQINLAESAVSSTERQVSFYSTKPNRPIHGFSAPISRTNIQTANRAARLRVVRLPEVVETSSNHRWPFKAPQPQVNQQSSNLWR